MPTVSRFFGIIVIMFYREGLNEQPHFHVRYSEYKAKISIKNLSIIKGKLPPRVLGFVMEWASLHQNELIKNWNRIENHQPLIKIAPLT